MDGADRNLRNLRNKQSLNHSSRSNRFLSIRQFTDICAFRPLEDFCTFVHFLCQSADACWTHVQISKRCPSLRTYTPLVKATTARPKPSFMINVR